MRSRILPALLSSLTALLLSASLLHAASSAPEAFEILPGTLAAEADSYTPQGVVAEFTARLDRRLLASDPARLSLPLPDGRTVTANRTHGDRPRVGEFNWFGELDDANLGGGVAGTASFHFLRGRLLGTVLTADGVHYRLIPAGELHRLVRLEVAAGNACGVAADRVEGAGAARDTAPLVKVGSDTDCAPPASQVTIDVMVLYPLTLAGGAQAVSDYANSKVNEANMIFTKSGVKITYNLVYVGRITGVQPPVNGDTFSARNWLNSQFATAAVDTEVELLRKAHGADMISVVIPPNPNANCGVANLPVLVNGVEVFGDNNSLPFGDKAFTAVELDCGPADYTFAHELGHTFGMKHDDSDPSAPRTSPSILPWAWGYILPTSPTRATVMGCAQLSPLDCRRIPHFSNPDVTYTPPGTTTPFATGRHSSQSATPSHNACVANTRATKYRAFAARPATTPPILAITSPADNTTIAAGSAVTLVATASDAQDGDLRAVVQWSSDLQGALGSGSPRTVTLSIPGEHLITAKVTDSTGTTVPYSIRIKALPRVTLSAIDPAASETPGNPGLIRLTRTGSTASSLTVVLNRTGTAANGTDYASITSGQNFAAGQSTKDIAVAPIDDTLVEDLETVTFTLASSAFYLIGSPASAMVTITNNDFTACAPTATRLCLQGGRFEATLSATANGTPYTGQAVPLTDVTGSFWLFSPANLEVGVKVVDGSAVNGNFWVFHGAATNVAYTLTIRDRANPSRVRTYTKPAGGYCGASDLGNFVKASASGAKEPLEFDSAPLASSAKAFTCTANATTTCLLGNRFQVRVRRGTVYQPVLQATSQTGFFWFFAAANLDLFVKVLDGTAVNGKIWVFFGSLTDQTYTVEVTDSATSVLKSYSSPGAHCGNGDTAAF